MMYGAAMLRLSGCVGLGFLVNLSASTALGQTASFPADDPAPAPAPAPAAAPAPATSTATPVPPGAPPPPTADAQDAAEQAPSSQPSPTRGSARSVVEEPPLTDEDGEEEAAARRALKKPSRHVSITFSPLHLFLPMFEAQVEGRLVPHLGLAAIAGIGSITAKSTDAAIGEQTFSAYELGAQLVGYPLEEFSSLQFGAELLWIHVSAESINGTSVNAAAGGVAVGPFVGYKVLTSGGFTFFAQGGFEYTFVKANASDNQGAMAKVEQSTVIPLLNLNLGWSF